MIRKHHIRVFIFWLILILAFSLRFYGSGVPWFDDEPDSIMISEQISFNPNAIHLPLYGTLHGPLPPYFIKMSMSIFGKSPLGARFLGIVLGTLSVIIMYYLVKVRGGRNSAIFAMILLSVDITHIFRSKYVADDIYLLFFGIVALFLFIQGIKKQKSEYLVWTSLAAALGFLARETICFFILSFILIMLLEGKNRKWIKKRDIVLSVSLFGLIISPYIVWLYKNEWIFYKINSNIPGFSLFPKAFLGVFLYFLTPFPRIIYDGNQYMALDIGYNSMGIFMGLTVLILSVLSFKNYKDSYVRAFLWMFCVFLAISFYAKGANANHFKLISLPAIVLSSLCFGKWWNGRRSQKYLIIFIFILILSNTIFSVIKIKYNNNYYSILSFKRFGKENMFVNLNNLGYATYSLAKEYNPTLIILSNAAWDSTGYYISALSEINTLTNIPEQKYFHYDRDDFKRVLVLTLANDSLEKMLVWFQNHKFKIKRIGLRHIILNDQIKIPVFLTIAEGQGENYLSKKDVKLFVYNIDSYE